MRSSRRIGKVRAARKGHYGRYKRGNKRLFRR